MGRGGGRTLHCGAGSGAVGAREADSEGEAKNHKRQAQHGERAVIVQTQHREIGLKTDRELCEEGIPQLEYH